MTKTKRYRIIEACVVMISATFNLCVWFVFEERWEIPERITGTVAFALLFLAFYLIGGYSNAQPN